MAVKGKYTENAPIIQARNVRLSFPHLAEPQHPREGQPGEPKFNASVIADEKSSVKITPADGSKVIYEGDVTAGMTKLLEHLISTMWGKRPPKMKPITCAGVVSEETGFGYNKDGERIDGYEDGNYTINGRNKKRPALFARDKSPLATKEEIESTLYAGCRVDASFSAFAADDQHGQAIYCTLRGVKFRADDEPFSGGNTASADEFDDSEDDASFG